MAELRLCQSEQEEKENNKVAHGPITQRGNSLGRFIR